MPVTCPQASSAQIAQVLDHYEPISLAEMDAVALLNRVDVKYMLTPHQLLQVLWRLSDCYRVLSVKEQRLQHYATLYFDQPNFSLYQAHHRGGQNRYKVRFRQYVDSNLTYLEVKHKNNKGRTLKHRQRFPAITSALEAEMVEFLRRALPFDAHSLEPKLWNNFIRVTLVNKQSVERVTLDFDLSFAFGATAMAMSQLVIAEVKLAGYSLRSPFIQQMRRLHASELSFSKYCIGAALRYAHLRQNNFKPVFLHMHKLGADVLSGTIP